MAHELAADNVSVSMQAVLPGNSFTHDLNVFNEAWAGKAITFLCA